MHCSRKHFRAWSLSPRPYILGEAGEMDQLLGDFTLAYKGSFPLLAIKEALIYQFRNGLAGCHTADTIFFAQLALRWNKLAWLPLAGANSFPHDLFQLKVAGQGAVSINGTHIFSFKLVR